MTDTHWHNVVAWDKTAEIMENNISKGKETGLKGRLTSPIYADKVKVKRM